MATGWTEATGAVRHTWRQRCEGLLRRLCCCICVGPVDRKYSPALDRAPRSCSAEDKENRESIRIMVEDLGMDNPGFIPPENDASAKEKKVMSRSTSSVSACQQTWQKRKLTPLSSLPIQQRAGRRILNSEDEADTQLFGDVTKSALLTPPLINLIPPTPSDVIDNDQFFDINSEVESVVHTFGSESVDSMGSQALGDRDSINDPSQKPDGWDSEPESGLEVLAGDEGESPVAATVEDDHTSSDGFHSNPDQAKKQAKPSFLRSAFQVAPLPEFPRKRSFNTEINLLEFTEQNLDDLTKKETKNHELLKTELLPLSTKMDQRKPVARTYSLGDAVPRSHNFHSMTKGSEEVPEDEGSTRKQRITVASYIPQTKDRNGNFSGKYSRGGYDTPLAELDTEGVCRWFVSIGLQKCLPFIREADLCGTHIATIEPNILQILHVSALEEREQLLSAIYRELHPLDTTTQKLDTLLESIGHHNIDRFTAALVSMSKSKSSPHVNYVSSTPSSIRFRERSRHSNLQRNSHLIEITINALEQIVHLRTPKETTVKKVMESCLKMLGVTDNKDLFSLRKKEGPLTEFSVDQQIGDLLGSEKRLLELHLCKKEKPEVFHPKVNGSHSVSNDNLQGDIRTKEEKIRELNQHVESLQHVIHQVQELHQSLVAFCEELRNMDNQQPPEVVCLSDVETQLRLAHGRLHEKQQSVQSMQGRLSNLEANKDRRLEIHLLDKMKLHCQIFKEEIIVIHLNRQVARLKSALQEFQAKEHTQMKSSTLGQLVSPQCPAILLATHEMQNKEGRYGFTVRFTEEAGLVVVHVENSQLYLNDRLVEVNGVSVLESGEEELFDLLFRQPRAQIVVLRKPPPLLPKPGCVPESVRQPSPASSPLSGDHLTRDTHT